MREGLIFRTHADKGEGVKKGKNLRTSLMNGPLFSYVSGSVALRKKWICTYIWIFIDFQTSYHLRDSNTYL